MVFCSSSGGQMLWLRSLSAATAHRTHQASGAVLLHVLTNQQHSCWSSQRFAGQRCLSTSSNDLQQAASTGAALTDPLQQCSTAATNLAVGDPASSIASSSSLLSSISSSSNAAGSSITQLWDAGGTIGSCAAQPLEPMWQLIHPVVLGCSFWESIHSLTGLPWWASIPVATLGLRTALLPFTIKAKSAGLNFVLAQQATETATNLLEHWKQQQAASGSSSSAASSSGSGGSSNSLGLGRSEELKRPSWLRLTRMYYRYYRKQHGTTSLWWWSGNIAVQFYVFLTLSASLRQMAATQWPGFTDQGFWLIQDLTQTAVVLGEKSWYLMHAPYSFAGFLLPFVLLWMYRETTQKSPVAQRPLMNLALETLMLPYLLVSCISMPQATLIYWATNSAFFMGLQNALARPRVASALGLPAIMLPHPRHDKEARERAELEALRAQQLVCGSEDVGFLRYLAASYVSRGMHHQALQVLQRLTTLSPGDADAFRALGTSAAEEQHWLQSARAFERAAELHAVAVDRQEHVECLLLAAKQWLNATAEARALQRRERKQQLQEELGLGGSSTEQQAGGEAAGAAVAGGKGAGSSVDEKVQPGQQQDYINSALELLQQAIHFQGDSAADAFYLLSMAQAAAGKWEPAYEAATTFWSRSLALAENDQTARINAAAKLLPVLNNLCKQRYRQKDYSAMVTVGELAVEVAKCGWDRQTEEQLRDTLGAAAQEVLEQGKTILSQQITELQGQLPSAVVRRAPFS